MSAVTRAALLHRLFSSNAALSLLRQDLAPEAVAILVGRLAGDERRIESEEFLDLVEGDLENLRIAGHSLPQTARSYVAKWRNEGILVRRVSEGGRGETYELSSQALLALRFLEELDEPRQSATESRLESVAARLHALAIDTDPFTERRLARLNEEKIRIETQIAAVASGEDEPMSSERATERLRDLLGQAASVPDDFSRIRTEFEALNATLREKVVESDDSQKAVLDDIFRGVDLIASSDAGRTFRAFTELVMDPAMGGSFEEDVDQILDRDFSGVLSLSQRRSLRQFMSGLKEQTAEVQQVMTSFARGLRRYVQSQDYQQDRVLRGMIQEALQAGLSAADNVKPYEKIGVDLSLTGVALSSVGALRLHDPSELDASSPVTVNETGLVDLASLREHARETEIDFDELVANVNNVLEHKERATIAEVLNVWPATQGLASIVGLLTLAAAHGVIDQDATERISWEGIDKVQRESTVARHTFVGRIA